MQARLLERRIDVTHAAIRQWCCKCGQDYANRPAAPTSPAGRQVAYGCSVFDDHWQTALLVARCGPGRPRPRYPGQRQRNKKAAQKVFRKLLKGLRYGPRVVITDTLKSYGAAKRERLPGVAHRQSRSLNKRCEHAHRPTRQREYRMQGCKSPGHVQRFLAAYGPDAVQPCRPGGSGCLRRSPVTRWGIDSRVGLRLRARERAA